MDASFQTRVRERAYYLWLEEGRPQGRAEHHWSSAERDLAREAAPRARRHAASKPGVASKKPAKAKQAA
jgi:hypothetical protein